LLVVGHAARFPLDRLALLPHGQLQQEKILEREPAMRRSPAAVQVFEVRIRSGEMDGLDRIPELYEPPPSHDLGWQGVDSAVGVLVYQSLHDGADPVAKHHPRLGLPTVIDGHDAAHVDQVVMAPGLSRTLQDLVCRLLLEKKKKKLSPTITH